MGVIFNPGSHTVGSSLAMLLIRISCGGLMLMHGVPKFLNFSKIAPTFDPLGMGGGFSLGLTVFAELFCAIFILIGVGTRLATIPLIIVMLVAVFVVHLQDPMKEKELAIMYLLQYLAILFAGAGHFSLDSVFSKGK